MPAQKFVIDTSLFVNPQVRKPFGDSPGAAVRAFVKMVEKMDVSIYMPPSVFKELNNFADKKSMTALEIVIKKRAPNTYSIFLPAAVFYDFIEDIRNRMNKGMRLAEEYAIDNKPENDAKLKKLREKYRDAMRAGILDSKEDFELVLLAKELEASLVSADEGVNKFADQVGCETLAAGKFFDVLKKLKKH